MVTSRDRRRTTRWVAVALGIYASAAVAVLLLPVSYSEIVRALKDAWRRIGARHYDAAGRYLGQRIELANKPFHRQLQSLPALSANFDHVSGLDLSNSDFSDVNVPFLSHFTALQALILPRAS